MPAPRGIWLFAHDLSHFGNDPSRVVTQAQAAGARGVIMKCHDGATAGVADDGGNFAAQFRVLYPVARAAGLGVAAWGYNYLTDVATEVEFIAAALRMGADFYLFDAEDPISGKHAQVQKAGQLLRAEFPQALLGHCPAPSQDYPPDYPWAEFNGFADFVAPQLYWRTFSKPVDQVWAESKAVTDGWGYPIANGTLFPIGTLQAPADEVSRFAVDAADCPGTAWWNLDVAGADVLAAIAATSHATEQIQPPAAAPEQATVQPAAPPIPLPATVPTWAADATRNALAKGVITDPTGGSDFYRCLVVLDRLGLFKP